MLDKLKPAWGVYKCRESLDAIPREELLGLLMDSEEGHQVNAFFSQWSVAMFVLMMMVTCCAGG